MWTWGLSAGVLATVAAIGCWKSSATQEKRKPTYPVSGKVLVNDRPGKDAFVLFTPVNEPPNTPDPRPRALAGEDGSFKVSTYDADDGAPAGEYIITVTWPGGVLPDGREEPPDKLLGRYSDVTKSQLRATVKEGANELPPFKLR